MGWAVFLTWPIELFVSGCFLYFPLFSVIESLSQVGLEGLWNSLNSLHLIDGIILIFLFLESSLSQTFGFECFFFTIVVTELWIEFFLYPRRYWNLIDSKMKRFLKTLAIPWLIMVMLLLAYFSYWTSLFFRKDSFDYWSRHYDHYCCFEICYFFSQKMTFNMIKFSN